MTIATIDFAFVMLAESALSFLGIGIQPPEITWGLMVAQGRNYLAIAWWLERRKRSRGSEEQRGKGTMF